MIKLATFPFERLALALKKPFASLLGLAFFSISVDRIYIPFLVLFLTSWLGFSASLAAMSYALLFLISGIVSPVAGIFLDHSQPKPMLLAACVFDAIGVYLLIYGVHGQILRVICGVGILGIGRSLFRVSIKVAMSRLLPSEDFPSAFGSLHAARNMGMILTPAVAGILLVRGYPLREIFSFALAGYVILCALIAIIFPHNTPCLTAKPKSIKPKEFFISPVIISYLTLSFIDWACIPQPSMSLAVYLSRIHIQPAVAGFFFAAQALAVVIFVPLAGRCMRGWETSKLFKVYTESIFILPLGFLIFSFFGKADIELGLFCLGFIMLIEEMLAVPSGDPLSALLVPEENHGLLFGLSSSVSSFGSFFGASVGGWFLGRAEKNGFMPDYWKNIGIVFLCAWALAAMFALFSLRRHPWPAEATPHA